MKWKNIIFIIIILVCIGIAYSNAFQGVFIFDDYGQVMNNPYIKTFKNLPTIFSTGFNRLHLTGANYYRPLLESTYVVDYFLWGNDKVVYHLTNVLCHMLSAVMLFLLINAVFKNSLLSFLTALLFGVNPIYTSAVTYISGRADSMVILLLVSSLFYYIKYLETQKRSKPSLIIAIILYFLALLTKEISLFFILIIMLYTYFPARTYQYKNEKERFMPCGIFITIIIFYGILRARALQGVFTASYNVTVLTDTTTRILTSIKTFGAYILLILMPKGLHLERTIAFAKSVLDPAVLFSLAIFALCIYLIIRFRRTKGPVFYGMLWYFITFIPVSNIFIPLNAFIAENWIQFPAIGFFLVIAAVASNVIQAKDKGPMMLAGRFIILPIFAAAIIWYIYLTVDRNKEYADPILFYTSALEYEPESIKLNNNLAVEYEKKGQVEKAIQLYSKVLEKKPDHSTSLNNLANIYSAKGRYDDAIAMYQKALRIEKDNIAFLNNLGVAYIRKGDKKNALYYWRRSLDLKPNQPGIKQYIEWNQ